jgi:hypothetical protein
MACDTQKFSRLTESFWKRLIYAWKVVELELGMFIAQQLVCSSLLKMNTWNAPRRQQNVTRKNSIDESNGKTKAIA